MNLYEDLMYRGLIKDFSDPELKDKLNSNKEYLNLMSEFEKNKKLYIENNTLNDEIMSLRKKLFNIDELKEYLKIQNNLRLLSININNIILSVLD